MSKSKQFHQELGNRLLEHLPDGYTFSRSKLQWKKRTANGYDVIQIGGKNKYSPYISVSLCFGKLFDDVSEIEMLLDSKVFNTHIQVDTGITSNVPRFPYLGPSFWRININSPPDHLESEMLQLIEGLGFPFFNRFTNAELARDEMEKEKRSWCNDFSWMQLFHLNAALSDVDRFVRWSKMLPPLVKEQADNYVARFQTLSQDQ